MNERPDTRQDQPAHTLPAAQSKAERVLARSDREFMRQFSEALARRREAIRRAG